MGKPSGFLEYQRKTYSYKPVAKRKHNFDEFIVGLGEKENAKQAARCMDCGTPFCHIGCPLGNIIPDFNHQVYLGNYQKAYQILKSTNNFPNFTGRICPAPCESSCVLAINKPAVSIKNIEYAISEEARKHGWDQDWPTATGKKVQRNGKHVAIVGSGPAGLAAADQLNSIGYSVTVYEKSKRLGGLLTYGIPNFKLEKKLVFHEIKRMQKQGVRFLAGMAVGKDISLSMLRQKNDAVILAIGATIARDLPIENRDIKHIHFAMDFLTQSTEEYLSKGKQPRKISAENKHVIVLGGGDTGSDCIGTAIRQKAKSVTQIEIMPQAPHERDHSMPWPLFDHIFRVSSSQAEGCKREFSILTKGFLADKQQALRGIRYSKVTWDAKKKSFQEQSSSENIMPAGLVLLAMGFTKADTNMLTQNSPGLGKKLILNNKGQIVTKADTYHTLIPKVFSAGDARRGQSLIVWAISEGRECARSVDAYIMKKHSTLKAKDLFQSDWQAIANKSQHEHEHEHFQL